MSVQPALKEITSHEFAARLNVVSGMRSFFTAAGHQPAVVTLYQKMRDSGEALEEVLGHIHDLSQLEVDRRYENPNDAALAILLWLTLFCSTNPGYYHTAAELVDRAPQCWYAKKLARRVLIPPSVASDNTHAGEYPRGYSMVNPLSGDMVVNVSPTFFGATAWHHLIATGVQSNDGASVAKVGT